MGLEKHIDLTIEEKQPELDVRISPGYDYWFWDGLRTSDIAVARAIKEILDESGNFGPTTIVKTHEEPHSPQGSFKIVIGTHPMFRKNNVQSRAPVIE